MSIKEMADEVTRKQREKALSRRDEAENNYLMLTAAAIDGMAEGDKAERERLELAEEAATDALEARCGACPNADICIASLRHACPHFIRMVVAGRRKAWHEFLKAKAHFCGECTFCKHDECWCRLHKKVVELDTPACGDMFPDAVTHELPGDPDPLWFPDRPLSPREQEIHERSRRETAERIAKLMHEDPETYKRVKALGVGRYEEYEKEFPELFGGEAHGQS